MDILKKNLAAFFVLSLFLLSTPVLAQSTEIVLKAPNDFGLSALASRHRIVFLGETNHGVSQQFAAIAVFTEKMFAENDFELLQSESSFFSTYTELLKKGKPAIQGLSMIYGDTEEFSTFVDFAQSKELLHAGFDPQVIISSEDIVLIINQFELAAEQKENFQDGMEDLASNIIADDAFLELCKELIEKNQKDVLKRQLLKNLLWANEILVKTDHLSVNKFEASHSNYRDRAMAVNFLFWDDYFGHKKTIAIGASTHLSYGFDQIDNEELRQFIPMGKTVKEYILKTDIVNIALSIKNGKSRALNDNESFAFPIATNVLENGHPHYPILLNTDSLQHHASLVMGKEVVSGNWSTVFDYILVFENVTPISHRAVRYEAKIYEGRALQDATPFILKEERSGAAIEFAHVYFSEKGEGTTSNDKGLFVIKDPERYADNEMIISRIGYLTKTIPFPSNRKDTIIIHLTADVQMLDEVVVGAEALTPLAIMQKVRSKLASMEYLPQLNYYHVVSDIGDGQDSLHNETIVQLMFEPDAGLDLKKGIGSINVLTRKKLKKPIYNKFKAYLSYPFAGATWTHPTVLQLFHHDIKRIPKYFSLREEKDTLTGLTKIHFKALNTSRKVTGFTKPLAYEGTIWVNEDSYLPVKIDLFIKSEGAGEFYFSTDFAVKNNTLITIFSQLKHMFIPEEGTNRRVILEETSTWLKQDFLQKGDQVPHTSHDMTLIKPDQKIWDQFNEFIK